MAGPFPDRRSNTRREIDRVYAVSSDSASAQGRCYLDDGSAVICAFDTIGDATEATADDSTLRLVRHRSLSSQEQQRVAAALLS